MSSKVIRIDTEVYQALLGIKAELEKRTGKAESFTSAVRTLIKEPPAKVETSHD